MIFPNLHDIIDPISLTYHLENTSFGIMLWNKDMKLVYCSEKAANILGYLPVEMLQKPFSLLKLVHTEDVAAVDALIAEIFSGRTTHNESLNRNVSKEGKIIYCQWYNSALKDEVGNVINILSLLHDVTTQVETQMALKKSEELALAFNSAIDPMWLIRMEGPNIFRFETINLAFTKVTDWTPEQVEGQLMEKVIPPPSHALVREKYNEAISSGRIVDYIEESQHPSGVKYAEIRVIPIWGEEGEPTRILGIANDMTEKVYLQKKLESEREKRSRQITSAAIRGQESERAKVSRELHDNVNQILTTVKLYLELSLEQMGDSNPILSKCISLVNNTISEIRHLSKQLSAPSLGNMNFIETLTDLVESLRPSTGMDVTLELEKIPCPEMENELHLTLYRLAQEQFTNIIKYAKANKVVVNLRQEGSFLYFTIVDDGIGFDPTQKRRGIGITNMQSRVEILNGRFQILSKVGEGTKLEVQIPVIIEGNVCYAEQTVLNLTT